VEWIGRRVEMGETKEEIEILLDARRMVTHRRATQCRKCQFSVGAPLSTPAFQRFWAQQPASKARMAAIFKSRL
jgi:hypothetical protein